MAVADNSNRTDAQQICCMMRMCADFSCRCACHTEPLSRSAHQPQNEVCRRLAVLLQSVAALMLTFLFTCRSMPVHRPAGTSLENNNVFTVQPTVYFEGMDPATESASMYQDVDLMPSGPLNPATVTVGIVALGIVAVAGSATAIYYEVRLVLVQQHCWLFGCSCLRIWLECFDCSAPQAVVLL